MSGSSLRMKPAAQPCERIVVTSHRASRAAVFSGPLLLGVVRHDRGARTGARLSATRSHELLRDDAFARTLTAHTGLRPETEAADLADLLSPAPLQRAVSVTGRPQRWMRKSPDPCEQAGGRRSAAVMWSSAASTESSSRGQTGCAGHSVKGGAAGAGRAAVSGGAGSAGRRAWASACVAGAEGTATRGSASSAGRCAAVSTSRGATG
ncbi:hypothetical protein ACF1BU_15400 [Streptomyces sp. NPDC014724]|uniref:hypothetical protein n=1 Tax=unclassified Streptomyces TaxID=2593676 RepID=UPI0036F4D46B